MLALNLKGERKRTSTEERVTSYWLYYKLNSLLLKKTVPTVLPRRMGPILFLIVPRKLGSLKRMIISKPELITLCSIEGVKEPVRPGT